MVVSRCKGQTYDYPNSLDVRYDQDASMSIAMLIDIWSYKLVFKIKLIIKNKVNYSMKNI